MKTLILLLLTPLSLYAQITFKAVKGADVTTQLQKSLNDNKDVTLDGQYIISAPLTIQTGGSLVGVPGATLTAKNKTGLLKSRNIYINLSGKSNVQVAGITFTGDNTPANGWAAAAILLQGSNNCTIENNTFAFAYPYNKGSDAVWVTQSNYNTIRNNVCQTVGITYAENGSSYNVCEGNQIYSAQANALGGIGNSTIPNLNNVVRNNYVENAGRIGIEDQQNSIGTVLQGNIINGTGKGASDGIGISAVANNTTVIRNTVTGYRQYAIEAGGNCGNRVIGNEITGGDMGIIANFTKPVAGLPTLIQGNRLFGAGIQIFGSVNPVVVVDGNTITDAPKGIDLDWGNGSADIQATNNVFYYNAPTNKTRVGLSTYSSLTNGKQGGTRVISGNVFYYSPSAVLGSGIDYGMILTTDNTTSQGNALYGFKKGRMYGMTSNGTKPVGGVVGVNSMEGL